MSKLRGLSLPPQVPRSIDLSQEPLSRPHQGLFPSLPTVCTFIVNTLQTSDILWRTRNSYQSWYIMLFPVHLGEEKLIQLLQFCQADILCKRLSCSRFRCQTKFAFFLSNSNPLCSSFFHQPLIFTKSWADQKNSIHQILAESNYFLSNTYDG